MKKIISITLAIVMIFVLTVPAFASVNINESKSQIPIIRISGDGEPLYDNQGNRLLTYTTIFSAFETEEGEDNTELYKSIANVILPFAVDGLLNDNWEPYYDALYEEIAELFGNTLLDKDGNPQDGSGLSEWRKENQENLMKTNKYGTKKYFAVDDYFFFYDWRLDPTVIADEFHEFITSVKEVTGCEKVGIIASCLGTSVVMAYIAKYGTDDINGIGFDGTVCNGSEIISETISGKFRLDGNSITRVLEDCKYLGVFDIDEFIIVTLDLLVKSGALDVVSSNFKDILYYKIIEGVTSALALSTFCTWPGYWSTVSEEDYDDAMLYVFGEEGSEKRTEYAGLIEKIENYDNLVRGKTYDLLKQAEEDGVNIGIISKYGYQIIPVCESGDELADELVTVKKSSFGATTSKIFNTLSDEYIANVPEENLKYISPDRQIDASTCLFPDKTWFIKGASHATWTAMEMKILYDVVSSDKQITVNDTEISQFFVHNNEENKAYKMTEENCDTYVWSESSSSEPAASPFEFVLSFLKTLFKWFSMLFEKFDLGAMFGGEETTIANA